MPIADSIAKTLKAQVDACEQWRASQIPKWQRNVEYRLNKILDAEPDRDEVLVPIDWARTRNKIAQLYFQVPKVTLFPRAPQWRPFTGLVTAVINYQLQQEIHAERTIEESLGDAINAAGVGIYRVSYEAEFEDVKEPAADLAKRKVTELIDYVKTLGGAPPPTTVVKKPIYQKVEWNSVDPADFLFPLSFNKIDFQRAPWLGENFRITRAEAERRGWLKPGERAGGSEAAKSVNEQYEQTSHRDDSESVRGTRIWYRPFLFDAKERDCRKIKVLVWIDGKENPVVDEDFPWQKYSTETKEWVGMTTFPLKVLTLTHVSGQAIPPSDSEIGRPQVRELNRSRTQMLLQRDRSNPLRWFDVGMVDSDVVEQIRRGTWQDMIPTQGPGHNAIGEVARASYPRESYEFQNVLEKDLDNGWSMGPNQGGYEASGATSATEAEITQRNYAVGLEHQRAKVGAWFLEGAESSLDLMQMFFQIEQYVPFGKIGSEKSLEAWDRDRIPGKFTFSMRPDGATRVDMAQKRAGALNFYKLTRQDPLINPQKTVADLFEAHDIDPSEGFAPPPPPQEEKPKPPTFSFKGEDLVNPVVIALIQKTTPITPQELQAARLLMGDAGIPIAPATTLPDTTQVDGAPPAGGGQPVSGESAPHGGMTGEVLGIGRRYEAGSGGQKDDQQGMVGEGTGLV
jgi:hypothetical protein